MKSPLKNFNPLFVTYLEIGRMWLRPYLSLPSIVISLTWEDPREFFLKIQQRFGIRIRGLSGNGTSASVRNIEGPCNYKLPGDIQWSTRNCNNGRTSVLYFANNSMPYTQSGYTVRTHGMLRAYSETSSRKIICVTRLGYPVVVGRIPKSREDIIDGVIYRRIIPRLFMPSRRLRAREEIRQLTRIAKAEQVGVIHTTTDYRNAYIASHVAKRLSIPWIYEVRGERENTWLSQFEAAETNQAAASRYYSYAHEKEFEAMKKAARVIFLSEVAKADAVSNGLKPVHACVIPNSLPGRSSAAEVHNSAQILVSSLVDKNKKYIGTVSSLVHYEGLSIVVQALPFLPGDVNALFVGDGIERSRLEALARSLGVCDRVVFAGKQPTESISEWYRALDVFVVPRISSLVTARVTPIKTLEAMRIGIPVLASDLPALHEVTGELAVYFEPGQLEDFVRKIKMLLDGNVEVNQKRVDRWLRTRSWEHNVKNLEAMYTELTGEK